MRRGPTGDYGIVSTVGNEPVKYFVPRPLPPDQQLEIDTALRDILDRALLALGRLDGLAGLSFDTLLMNKGTELQ